MKIDIQKWLDKPFDDLILYSLKDTNIYIILHLTTNTHCIKLLFEEWDNYFKIDPNILIKAFTERELKFLNSFDEAVSRSLDKLNEELMSLTEYQKTKDWNVLNSVALEVKKEIK